MPQITGGVTPPGLETENESVKHCVPTEAGMALPAGTLAACPYANLTTSIVLVEGPAILKLLKSNLSYI